MSDVRRAGRTVRREVKRTPTTDDRLVEVIIEALGDDVKSKRRVEVAERVAGAVRSYATDDVEPGEGWIVEETGAGDAYLVTPNGYRAAVMTTARARGAAAALNSAEGHAAFERARLGL